MNHNHIETCEKAGIQAAKTAFDNDTYAVPAQCVILARCIADKDKTNTAMELITAWSDNYHATLNKLSDAALREMGFDFPGSG